MKAELVLGNLKRERDALDGRLERLSSALCKDWKDEVQEYLCEQQYNAMSLYAHILDERIADIEYKLEQRKKESSKTETHETCHCNKTKSDNKINVESYSDYIKNNCSEDAECNHDPMVVVIEMVKDIFGDELFDGGYR